MVCPAPAGSQRYQALICDPEMYGLMQKSKNSHKPVIFYHYDIGGALGKISGAESNPIFETITHVELEVDKKDASGNDIWVMDQYPVESYRYDEIGKKAISTYIDEVNTEVWKLLGWGDYSTVSASFPALLPPESFPSTLEYSKYVAAETPKLMAALSQFKDNYIWIPIVSANVSGADGTGGLFMPGGQLTAVTSGQSRVLLPQGISDIFEDNLLLSQINYPDSRLGYILFDDGISPGLSDLEKHVILHEVGHAIGLAHPDGDGDNEAFDLDDTVMSYRIPVQAGIQYNRTTLSKLDRYALSKIWGFPYTYVDPQSPSTTTETTTEKPSAETELLIDSPSQLTTNSIDPAATFTFTNQQLIKGIPVQDGQSIQFKYNDQVFGASYGSASYQDGFVLYKPSGKRVKPVELLYTIQKNEPFAAATVSQDIVFDNGVDRSRYKRLKVGTSQNDGELKGSKKNDQIYGFGGSDVIYPGAGANFIDPGAWDVGSMPTRKDGDRICLNGPQMRCRRHKLGGGGGRDSVYLSKGYRVNIYNFNTNNDVIAAAAELGDLSLTEKKKGKFKGTHLYDSAKKHVAYFRNAFDLEDNIQIVPIVDLN